MFGLKRSSFKSRRDAYGTFFSYFTAPMLIIGVGIAGVSKSQRFGLISEDRVEQSVYLIIIVSIILSICCWYKAFRAFLAIVKDDFENIPDTVICVDCHEPFIFDKMKNYKCKECEGVLEDLQGFYDRHPELREGQ